MAESSVSFGTGSRGQSNMADYVKVLRTLLWTVMLLVGMTGTQALAQSEPRLGPSELRLGPIYNPASKSYFELRYKSYSNGLQWWRHRKSIADLQFKGVHGRLAIVDTYATHIFLMENFQLDGPAWIGLYVDCKTMNAYWIDGKQQLNNEVNLWRNPYYNHRLLHCAISNIKMMPVWILPQQDRKHRPGYTGFRWVATGPAKAAHFMFVEYPTGGE